MELSLALARLKELTSDTMSSVAAFLSNLWSDVRYSVQSMYIEVHVVSEEVSFLKVSFFPTDRPCSFMISPVSVAILKIHL